MISQNMKQPWSQAVMQENLARIKADNKDISCGETWENWMKPAQQHLGSTDIKPLTTTDVSNAKVAGQDPEVANPVHKYLCDNKVFAASHSRIGYRSAQEDRDIIQQLQFDKTKTPESYAKAFYEAIDETGKEILKPENSAKVDRAGSCFIGALQVGRNVITANIGDSNCMVIMRSKATGIFSSQVMNWWQKPTVPCETKRIQDERGLIFNRRLGGDLAIARAFGDGEYITSGLTYLPEFTMFEIPDDCEAWVVNCCDGISDGICSSHIVDIFKHSYNAAGGDDGKTLETFEANLMGAAYSGTARDNFSVTAVKVDPEHAIFSAVLDGHGGAGAAELAKNLLEQKIAAKVAPYKKQVVEAIPNKLPTAASVNSGTSTSAVNSAFHVIGAANPSIKVSHPICQCYHASEVIVSKPKDPSKIPDKGVSGALIYHPDLSTDELLEPCQKLAAKIAEKVLQDQKFDSAMIKKIMTEGGIITSSNTGDKVKVSINFTNAITKLGSVVTPDIKEALQKANIELRKNPADNSVRNIIDSNHKQITGFEDMEVLKNVREMKAANSAELNTEVDKAIRSLGSQSRPVETKSSSMYPYKGTAAQNALNIEVEAEDNEGGMTPVAAT